MMFHMERKRLVSSPSDQTERDTSLFMLFHKR